MHTLPNQSRPDPDEMGYEDADNPDMMQPELPEDDEDEEKALDGLLPLRPARLIMPRNGKPAHYTSARGWRIEDWPTVPAPKETKPRL